MLSTDQSVGTSQLDSAVASIVAKIKSELDAASYCSILLPSPRYEKISTSNDKCTASHLYRRVHDLNLALFPSSVFWDPSSSLSEVEILRDVLSLCLLFPCTSFLSERAAPGLAPLLFSNLLIFKPSPNSSDFPILLFILSVRLSSDPVLSSQARSFSECPQQRRVVVQCFNLWVREFKSKINQPSENLSVLLQLGRHIAFFLQAMTTSLNLS